MDAQKTQQERQPTPLVNSCRKKKNEEASFLEDVKDHIDEFIYASMDEHKTCFKKTIQKMFGMSNVVAERSADAEEVESSLPLRSTVSKYVILQVYYVLNNIPNKMAGLPRSVHWLLWLCSYLVRKVQ